MFGKIGQWIKRQGTKVALAFGIGGMVVQSASATFTDPAADINTAVAAAGAGASTAYTSTLTVLASVVLVGLVIWGLRKGVRPR